MKSDNIYRTRHYGLRMGDHVSYHNTINGIVIHRDMTDNNSVIIEDGNGEKHTVTAEHCKIIKKIEDIEFEEAISKLEEQYQNLMVQAREAMINSYSPYSNFPVGCAVLTKNGKIYKGSNAENASYGLTICAERTVLSYLAGNNIRDIEAIAVIGKVETLSPCGACRQYIIEFGLDIDVLFWNNNEIITKTISDLLPYGFSPESLK